MSEHAYIIIDLKSFYASCECVDRGLDPMTTDLVVADPARGGGTICLAISPSLKAKGVRNRCRVFEIPSCFDYIKAEPRMQLYINYAGAIYSIYLDYFDKNDIYVYSVDEAFIDVGPYLSMYHMTPRELGKMLLEEIAGRLGLPASLGIGTNLYLAKIALDITAKHKPDRIGELDERLFQTELWEHRPLTDFWRIGKGIARRLENIGLTTMGRIAHASPKRLVDILGINGYILYDHSWGREPTTIQEIKAYHPREHSVSNGQVLLRDYSFSEALLILKEMADELSLDLVRRGVAASSATLYVGFSRKGDILIPSASGTVPFAQPTNSSIKITEGLVMLFHEAVSPSLFIRRICLTANHVIPEGAVEISLFDAPSDNKEHALQNTILSLKSRFGKNSILRGMDLFEAATTRQRNEQIGGHKKGRDGTTAVRRIFSN